MSRWGEQVDDSSWAIADFKIQSVDDNFRSMNWDTLELFKLRAFHNQVNPCITSAHYLEAHDADPLDQEILIDFEENEVCIPISAQEILHKFEPSGSRIDQAKHQPEEEKLESLIFNGSKESDSQI